MADEKPKAAEEDEAPPVNQTVLGLAKHVTSWRLSFGDDVVDEALALSAEQRKASAKADAAQARAEAGQQPTAAPTGRAASDPKTTATA